MALTSQTRRQAPRAPLIAKGAGMDLDLEATTDSLRNLLVLEEEGDGWIAV